MSLFILSTADMFLILAACSDSSPFSNMGASREMLQMMSYEPMTLLIAVGFYLSTGSFRVEDIIASPTSAIWLMPGPVHRLHPDHGHQAAQVPVWTCLPHIMPTRRWSRASRPRCPARRSPSWRSEEYYEKMLLLGIVVAIFFINASPLSWPIAIALTLFVYFIEILIDNVCAPAQLETGAGCLLADHAAGRRHQHPHPHVHQVGDHHVQIEKIAVDAAL